MELSSSRRASTSRSNVVFKRIERAIRGRPCPICLKHINDRTAAVITVCMHSYCIDCIRKWSNLKRKCPLCNGDFDSWFFRISLSSQTFHREQLPALKEDKKRRRITGRHLEQRLIRRSREELSCVCWRTRPLPNLRSFEQSRLEPPDVVTERVLRWRANIYQRGLQAVPCSSRNSLELDVAGNAGVKERILQRIEPWVRRELQAILGDPDPSVIVHVATSLFIRSLEGKHKVPSGQLGVEDNYLEPLRPFLLHRTNEFWHELSCFAESSFTMETYDTVVQYRLVRLDPEMAA